MKIDFNNKKVLVTGSSRGIGFSIANSFLLNGAQVCYTARSLDSFEKCIFPLENKENKILKECDFTKKESISSLRNFIEDEFDFLNILICNVGSGKSVLDPIPSNENFEKVFNLNFFSAVNTVREFLPLLEKSKGCILFISSICGSEALDAPVDYSVAKSALQSFSKHLSRSLGKKLIRVNSIALGNIYFPDGTWEIKMKENSDKVKHMLDTCVPLKRFGTPEEVASASLFLCSEHASFITGSILTIDGGQTTQFH